MTKREQILEAIKSALTGTAQVGSRIYRSRAEAYTRDEVPAIAVDWPGDPARALTMAKTEWTLRVNVTVLVRGSVPDQLADPIVESLHAKIMADESLGGLSHGIAPVGVQFRLDEADLTAGEIVCAYDVTYRTARANVAT